MTHQVESDLSFVVKNLARTYTRINIGYLGEGVEIERQEI